jgi:hypothetical protein
MHSHEKWQDWVETLRRYKLDGLAAWLLEAGSPLNLLGAQALYASQPFVGGKQLEEIAQMLENEDETHAFTRFLQDEMKQ